MALLQIAEPGQAAAPHQQRLAAGIDLGTTHSLIASVRSGLAETLPDEHGQHLLPSVVRYTEDAIIVGAMAQAAAIVDPLNTLASIKRLIGRGIADIKTLGARLPYILIEGDSQMPRVRTCRGDMSPVEVSAEILKTLAQRAEITLGGPLIGVVITVPAYFDEAQRQATKDAARLAGLSVLRLLNEPTAAAVAYGLDREAEGLHAIYDLGGGTFDISILRLRRGVFEVLATAGDSALGGDDLDCVIAQWFMQQAGIQDDADHRVLRELLRDARNAKETLSNYETAALAITQPDGTVWQGTLTREQFNELVEPLLQKTLAPCRRAIRDAGLHVNEIQKVVLVGGSTRIPRVRELVAECFGVAPLTDIDPDRVVAIGAALQADVLVGNQPGDSLLLLDVIPLSLGIETLGGLVEKIIPRNTTLPVAQAQEFTTFKDGQTALAVHVLQGERELVSDCRSLARFELRGIPPRVAGAARIRVTFEVDADGLLSVTAMETTSGVNAHVQVKPSYGLSDEEITRMLTDSFTYAQTDQIARRVREEQVEATRALEALHAALAEDGAQLLTTEERARIESSLTTLQKIAQGTDAAAIRQALTDLENVCGFYVERRMNASIQRALTGHRIDEVY